MGKTTDPAGIYRSVTSLCHQQPRPVTHRPHPSPVRPAGCLRSSPFTLRNLIVPTSLPQAATRTDAKV